MAHNPSHVQQRFAPLIKDATASARKAQQREVIIAVGSISPMIRGRSNRKALATYK